MLAPPIFPPLIPERGTRWSERETRNVALLGHRTLFLTLGLGLGLGITDIFGGCGAVVTSCLLKMKRLILALIMFPAVPMTMESNGRSLRIITMEGAYTLYLFEAGITAIHKLCSIKLIAWVAIKYACSCKAYYRGDGSRECKAPSIVMTGKILVNSVNIL